MSEPGTLVDALLDATPVVPAGVTDELLLAAAAAMVTAREVVLAAAAEGARRPLGTPETAEKIAELARRQRGWADALAGARERLGGHRVAATKLRAYQTRQP